MINITTAEMAYETLARAVHKFPGDRAWQHAFGKYSILNEMVSVQWGVLSNGVIDQKGASPPRNLISESMDAVLFLRDDLIRTIGQRIWGLTFTLYPDGKFTIEYDCNKPEGYEETDETIDVSLTDFAAQINRK